MEHRSCDVLVVEAVRVQAQAEVLVEIELDRTELPQLGTEGKGGEGEGGEGRGREGKGREGRGGKGKGREGSEKPQVRVCATPSAHRQ
jgi:hypothetical protein